MPEIRPYRVIQEGRGWLLLGPTTPESDGYWRMNRDQAEIECRMLNDAYEAGHDAGRKADPALDEYNKRMLRHDTGESDPQCEEHHA